MLNSKSFRDVKPVAPYGKPKSRTTSKGTHEKSTPKRKISIFNRAKSLLKKSIDTLSGGEKVSPLQSNTSETSSANVPGGFFEEGHRSISSTSFLQNNIETQDKEQEQGEDEDENSIANKSNAKLAEFFHEKGDSPLTEIEMEGVMSLMRKSSSLSHNHITSRRHSHATLTKDADISQSSMINDTNPIFQKSRVLSNSSTSFKVPQYIPKFDQSSSTNNNNNNGSLRSTSMVSSRSTSTRQGLKRRIFDYSGVPSPYKTVVFRYPSHNRSVSTPLHNDKINKTSTNVTKPIAQTQKKMTNVASALVTLLENSKDKLENDKIKINPKSQKLANPYASIVRKPQQQQQMISTSPTTVAPAPVSVETPLEPKIDVTLTERKKDDILPPPSKKITPVVENLVTLEEKVTIPKPKTAVPSQSSFAFTFQNKKPEVKKPAVKKPEVPIPVVTPKVAPAFAPAPAPVTIPTPTPAQTTDKYSYDFETPKESHIDASTIDETKVDQFKSMFVF